MRAGPKEFDFKATHVFGHAEKALGDSKKGQTKARLQIEGFEGKAFHVAYKELKKDNFWSKVRIRVGLDTVYSVKMGDQVKKVAVNANSLSKRLLINKKSTTKIGTEEHKRIISHIRPYIENLEHIHNIGRLLSLNTQTVIKILKILATLEVLPGTNLIHFGKSWPSAEVMVHEPISLGARQFTFIPKKKLGEGGLGVVKSVYSLGFQVLKRSKILGDKVKDFDQQFQVKSQEEVQNESKTLTDIHNGEKLRGIQLPPYTCFPMSSRRIIENFNHPEKKTEEFFEESAIYIGYLGHHYTASLDQLSFEQTEGKTRIQDMTIGLKTLHDKGYIHGDIKTQNVLYGKNRTDLADFGGVTTEEEVKKLIQGGSSPQPSEIIGTTTPKKMSNADRKALHREVEKLKDPSQPKEEIASTTIALLRSRDVNLLGKTIVEYVLGPNLNIEWNPLFLNPQENLDILWDGYKIEKKLKENGFTDEQIALVKSMLNEDWKKRPSAAEVAQTL